MNNLIIQIEKKIKINLLLILNQQIIFLKILIKIVLNKKNNDKTLFWLNQYSKLTINNKNIYRFIILNKSFFINKNNINLKIIC